MKSLKYSWTALLSLSVIAVTGCGKKEPSTSAAPQTESTGAAAPNQEVTAQFTEIAVPDLQNISVSQLANMSTTSLTNLAVLAGSTHPDVATQVAAVKTSLGANRTVEALDQLKQLSTYAQSIPGAPAAIDTAKMMVSGWALKQGFDPAVISPILGALQQRDYASLASQAAILAGTGGLTEQQQTLINGVLSNYGIDTQVEDAIGKVKGLFNN